MSRSKSVRVLTMVEYRAPKPDSDRNPTANETKSESSPIPKTQDTRMQGANPRTAGR